jgi:hypothetical protein
MADQIKVLLLVTEKMAMAQRTPLNDKAASCLPPCRLEMIRRISRDTCVVTALLALHYETSRPRNGDAAFGRHRDLPLAAASGLVRDHHRALFFHGFNFQTTRKKEEQTQKQEARKMLQMRRQQGPDLEILSLRPRIRPM